MTSERVRNDNFCLFFVDGVSVIRKGQTILAHHRTLLPLFADLCFVFFHCNWGSRALPRRPGQCQLMIYAGLRNTVEYLKEILNWHLHTDMSSFCHDLDGWIDGCALRLMGFASLSIFNQPNTTVSQQSL